MRFKFFIVAITCIAVIIPYLALAQQDAVITGRVTDETGTPLVGANVFIKALALGAATNADGMFSFTVPAAQVQGQEASLTVKFIGYKSKSEWITLQPGKITTDFTLAVDVLELEELVITGMGVGIEKEKLGVTIGKVSALEVVNSNEENVLSSLHGKVANVEVTSASGEPGAATYFRIRGANTIQGSTQPLIVVDGSPINNSTIFGGNSTGGHGGITPSNRASDINPEDIESIEVLKGAAASAIYGSRAGGGVVMITTKSGRPGKVRVSYKTSYSFDKVNKFVPVQTTYGQGINGQSMTGNIPWSYGAKLDPNTPTYDHAREMFETGHVFENTLTISGGNENTTYYLSVSRHDNNSVIKGNSEYERTTVRLKGSQRITDKINVHGNFAFADVSVNYIQRGSNVSGLLIGALRTPPDFNNLPYLNEFGVHRSYRRPDRTTLTGTRGYDNPFFIVNEHMNKGDVGRTFGNVKAEYDPFNWLNISYTLGYDFSEDIRRTVLPLGSSDKPDGRVIREKWTDTELDGFLAINARKSFKNANVNVVFGHQFNHREFQEFRTIGDGMSVFGFNHLENTSSWTPDDDENIVRDESYFAQVMVDLWDQLFLTGTMRNDGSSTFGASERRHWFPAMSGSWEFTKLKAFENIGWLNFGKVRAAYGEAGRQPGAYQTITAFSAASYGAGWGVFLDATAFGFGGFETSFTKGNDKIKPERTKETEFGMDLALLNNRVGMNLTRYLSETEDVIFSLPVPRSTGFGAQLQNAGTIENDGWELGIDLKPISMKDFKWDVGLIYGTNESLVKDLASDVSGAERVGLGGFVSANAQAFEGQPYGVIFGEDFMRFGRGNTVNGVDIDNAFTGWKPGDLYIGDDGFPLLDPEPRVIGDPNPDWTGSIRNTFTLFNKVRISALIDIKNGGDVWNGTKGALYFFGTHKDTDVQYTDDNGQEQRGKRHVFEGVGPGAGKEVILDQDSWYGFGLGSGFTGPASQFVEDGSYVKLREISISYTFTGGLVRRSGLKSVDVRLSGRNLKTWTDYTGTDPETNLFATRNRQGFDYFNNPQTRSFVFTVRFNY